MTKMVEMTKGIQKSYILLLVTKIETNDIHSVNTVAIRSTP